MSEMARWQEQEDGSEERFQHNNFSSRIGEGSEERVLFILGEANLPLLDQCQVSQPSIRVDLKARVHHLGFER
jgi:hypothetical protein